MLEFLSTIFNYRFKARLLSLPRSIKRFLACVLDTILCVFAVWLSLALRLETLSPFAQIGLIPFVVAVTLTSPIFFFFGLYKAIFRYFGQEALLNQGKAVIVYGLLYFLIFSLVGVAGVPRSIGLTQPVLLLVFVAASRWLVGYWVGPAIASHSKADWPGVLIYGAGEAGQQLASAVNASTQRRLVGFIDDASALWNNTVNGWRVYSPVKLNFLIRSKGAKELWLAMPALTGAKKRNLIQSLRAYPIRVRTLPTLSDLASRNLSINEIRELDIDELLGREPVAPDMGLLVKDIQGKTVLVTGAGGSIGSELCRQILSASPKRLILLDHSEYSLYKINQELRKLYRARAGLVANADFLLPVLGSVTDDGLVTRLFKTWRPDTVYHAAAYKHVPLVESNPAQAIKNNVWGTLVCAAQAAQYGAGKFVLVSTDKAVRPTNIMGASKRVAELIIQGFAADANCLGTCFTMVRFGNVIGSSGSVIPLFRRQITEGGPVTVTDPEVTRYFMSIREAAHLVIQAGAMARGGEVFVLDMGEPVKITDLARELVELSGLKIRDHQNPDGDIELKFTGLRPGEKLYEELLIGDNQEETEHPKVIRAHEPFRSLADLRIELDALHLAVADNNLPAIQSSLKRLVVGYVA